MDCSPPGFSVHGISQARVLEWVALQQVPNEFSTHLPTLLYWNPIFSVFSLLPLSTGKCLSWFPVLGREDARVQGVESTGKAICPLPPSGPGEGRAGMEGVTNPGWKDTGFPRIRGKLSESPQPPTHTPVSHSDQW